jgi:hypothetical protein
MNEPEGKKPTIRCYLATSLTTLSYPSSDEANNVHSK